MKKKNESEYNAWNQHLISTKEKIDYSVRRMDLLTISISGAGIYIVFETLKEFKTGNVTVDNPMLLFAVGIAFGIAIILNFFSQISGGWANECEEKFINLHLNKLGKKYTNEEQNKYEYDSKKCDSKVNNYNLFTDILNWASILCMIAGIILLVVFNYSLINSF